MAAQAEELIQQLEGGVQLLEAADAAYSIAEQEFDRSLETREALEHAYLAATEVLDTEQHPQRAHAWLGLATIRRYQKGRRDDALAAYDEALGAAPENIEVWDAYLDYITYAVSAAALLAIVERMPASIRVQKLPDVIAVGQGIPVGHHVRRRSATFHRGLARIARNARRSTQLGCASQRNCSARVPQWVTRGSPPSYAPRCGDWIPESRLRRPAHHRARQTR